MGEGIGLLLLYKKLSDPTPFYRQFTNVYVNQFWKLIQRSLGGVLDSSWTFVYYYCIFSCQKKRVSTDGLRFGFARLHGVTSVTGKADKCESQLTCEIKAIRKYRPGNCKPRFFFLLNFLRSPSLSSVFTFCCSLRNGCLPPANEVQIITGICTAKYNYLLYRKHSVPRAFSGRTR